MKVLRGRSISPWVKAGEPNILAGAYGLKLGMQQYVNPSTNALDDYSFFIKQPGITVCALLPSGNFLMVRQFKQAAQKFLVECCSGVIEAGEAPEEAGLRELREETGFTADSLVLTCPAEGILVEPRKSPSLFHTAFALGGLQDLQAQALDETEEIEVLEYTPSEVWEMVRTGEIQTNESRAAIFNAALLGYIPFPD